MTRLLASLAAIASVALIAASSGSATAQGGCVTKPEYKRVHKGMTIAQVTRTFGTAGHRDAIATSDGYGSQIRSYTTCSQFSAVAISFSKVPGGLYRLDAKSAVWSG